MIITALAFVFLILFSPISYAINIPAGEPAPDFNLTSLEGSQQSLSKSDGKVTVLIYWRADHKRSLLALKDAGDVIKKLEGKSVRVITIVAGNDMLSQVKSTIVDNKIDFPVAVDYERQFYSDYGIRVYPTTVIVDKGGIITHSIPSHPLTYKKLLEGYVKKALGEIDESKLSDMLSPHNEALDKTLLESLRLYNLAMKFMENGMVELAANSVKKSIQVKPDLLKSHILLGFLYLEMEDSDNALTSFNKALELNPNSNDAKTGLGGVLIIKGDLDKAIKILKDAAVTNPYAQMTYYELGKAYELKGEKDKSIEMYKKAIEKIIHKQILPTSISKCK
jgi:peroxiredoxin/predicted negative regulator of RcsB-dependent stress response